MAAVQSGWQMQDPSTGQWIPIDQASYLSNTQAPVKGPDGQVYAHNAGLIAYQNSTPTGTPAPTTGGGGSDPWDPNAFAAIVGRPPTQQETAFYSTDPNWRTDVTNATPVADRNQPPPGAGTSTPDPGAGAPPSQTYAPPPDYSAPPPVTGVPAPVTPSATPPVPTTPGVTSPTQPGVGAAPGTPINVPTPGIINPYPGGDFVAPTYTPPAAFKAPDYTPPPAFTAPTYADAANDPGYQFAQQEGLKAIQDSAAAKGILGSGGTLKDIAQWNQGLATQQYGNVYNRDLGAYTQNYQTQYLDPYKNAYTSAVDTYNNAFATGQTKYQDDYQAALQAYQNNYKAWMDRITQSTNITTL